MGLVDDEGVVLAQHLVARQLGEQDAVGHELDQGVLADVVVKAHLPADRVAQLGAQLLGDARRDGAGGEPPGLGVADQPAHATAELEADLRDLRGLPGAGLTGDDHDLVVADRRRDVLATGADRQGLRVADRGDRGLTCGDALLGGLDRRLDPGPGAGARGDVAGAADRVEAPAEAVRLLQGEGGDALGERVQLRILDGREVSGGYRGRLVAGTWPAAAGTAGPPLARLGRVGRLGARVSGSGRGRGHQCESLPWWGGSDRA